MTNILQIEISGEQAVTEARNILTNYTDTDVNTVSIKLQRPPASTSTDTTGKIEVLTEPAEPEDSDERHKGSIREETSHHRVLYALHELNKEAPVKGSDVKELVGDVPDGTIYPTLTKLWERMMVDRYEVGNHHEYEITNYGETVLDEMGTPTDTLNNY